MCLSTTTFLKWSKKMLWRRQTPSSALKSQRRPRNKSNSSRANSASMHWVSLLQQTYPPNKQQQSALKQRPSSRRYSRPSKVRIVTHALSIDTWIFNDTIILQYIKVDNYDNINKHQNISKYTDGYRNIARISKDISIFCTYHKYWDNIDDRWLLVIIMIASNLSHE